MEERYINYDTNFNLSSKYSDITPYKGTTQDGLEEKKNLPFYFIEGADNTTCEAWEKMDTKSKKAVALYVM